MPKDYVIRHWERITEDVHCEATAERLLDNLGIEETVRRFNKGCLQTVCHNSKNGTGSALYQ